MKAFFICAAAALAVCSASCFLTMRSFLKARGDERVEDVENDINDLTKPLLLIGIALAIFALLAVVLFIFY